MEPIIIDISEEEATGIPQPSAETKAKMRKYIDLQMYMLTKDDDQLGYSFRSCQREAQQIYDSFTPRQRRVVDGAIVKVLLRAAESAFERRLNEAAAFHDAERYFRE